MSGHASGLIDSENKVVYLRSDLVKKYPEMASRIVKIAKDCGSTPHRCSPYPESCLSYLVMSFSSIDTNNIDSLLKKSYNKIVGYLVSVVFDDMNEIYDVCVAKDARGMGTGKNLIKSLTTKSIRPKIWLGINVENPMWSAVLKLYIRNGFLNPTPGNTTPHGKTVGITFVGLTYDGNREPSPEEILKATKKADKYRNLALGMSCSNKFTLTSSLLLKIKNAFIDRDREFAGVFRILCYDNDHRGVLGLQVSSIVEGSATEFSVSLPKGDYYSFYHTHPNICYVKYGCYIGWPSGQDMGNVFKTYVTQGILINMVFSKEGVYIISLTPEFQAMTQLLRDSSECVDRVYRAIKDRFGLSKYFGENVRKEVVADPKDLQAKLQKYHSAVSSYSLKTMIEEISTTKAGFVGAEKIFECFADTKFKGDPIIFSAKFFDWEYISRRLELEFSIKYAEDAEKLTGECPLKVDKDKGKGPYEGGEKCDVKKEQIFWV